MRAARVDANHTDIVDAFRAFGWLVHSTAALKGWCDLTVQRGFITHLIEVKTEKGKPTDSQKKLRDAGWQIVTVRSIDDVAVLSKRF